MRLEVTGRLGKWQNGPELCVGCPGLRWREWPSSPEFQPGPLGKKRTYIATLGRPRSTGLFALKWLIFFNNFRYADANVLMAMCNQHIISQKIGHPVGFGDPVLNSETRFSYSSLFTLLWERECVIVFCGETQIICSLCEVRD